MTKTLEELKRENAEAEAKSTEVPQTEEEETETEAVEEETEESSEVAEPGDGETEETETEAWMQSDEQASQEGAEKSFTGSDIAAAKRKLRAKLERTHNSEVEELRAEIEKLKSGGVQQQASAAPEPKRPRLEDFDHDEDAHQDALDRWYEARMEAKIQQATAGQQQTAQQRQAEENFNRAVDQHYERAAKLAKEANITAEVYQNADLAVRSAIEQAMPQRGDLVTEQLISMLGEGSEKVMYYLGRNKAELATLQSALLDDPTGMKAMLHIGKISSKISNPQKQTSRAPKPATQIRGDEGAGLPANAKALKKKYDAAAKSGDAQARFDARRAAKLAGVDVSHW